MCYCNAGHWDLKYATNNPVIITDIWDGVKLSSDNYFTTPRHKALSLSTGIHILKNQFMVSLLHNLEYFVRSTLRRIYKTSNKAVV